MASCSRVTEMCPICSNSYRDPKVLPCFHILCRDCVSSLMVAGRDKILCPVERCRKEISIEKNDPENLPDALPVYYKRDLRRLKDKVGTEMATCRVCMQSKRTTVIAVAVCNECDFVCQECVNNHSSKSKNSEHEIVSFLELSQTDNDVTHHNILKRQRTRSFTQKGKCKDPDHNKDMVSVTSSYCVDCSIFVCWQCEDQQHNSHNRMNTLQAAQHYKQTLVDKTPNVRVVHKRVAGAAYDVEAARLSVKDQQTVLRSSIDHAFSRLTKILERRKQEMVTRLNGIAEEKMKKLTEQKEELGRLVGEFERLEDYLECTVNMSTDFELLHSYKFIQEQSQATLQQGSRCPIQPIEVANIALKNNGESHLRSLCSKYLNIFVEQANASSCSAEGDGLKTAETEKFAHFSVKVVDKNHKPCTCSQNVSAKLKCIENDFTTSTEITESNTSNYEASYCPQFRGRHELSVFVNGNPIPGSPFFVNVTKPPLELGQSQGIMYGVTGPRGLTIDADDNILVCEWNGHKIVKLDKIGRQVREFGEGQVHHPASIATSQDGSIFVSDAAGEGCALLKYNKVGQLIKKIGQEGKQVCEFVNPRGVQIRADREVWVCDRDNNRIQIFDMNLAFLHNFDLNQIDPQLEQKPKPNDITFDQSGNFYVTDFANHCVLCFSASGDYLFNFSGNQKQKMHGPECITVDKADYLYVTESGNHRVSIFKPTGELVRTFGGLGKNEGDLKFPMGIIVDKNGSVFVAELLNNRIQMF